MKDRSPDERKNYIEQKMRGNIFWVESSCYYCFLSHDARRAFTFVFLEHFSVFFSSILRSLALCNDALGVQWIFCYVIKGKWIEGGDCMAWCWHKVWTRLSVDRFVYFFPISFIHKHHAMRCNDEKVLHPLSFAYFFMLRSPMNYKQHVHV